MSDVLIACSHCGEEFEVDKQHLGKSIECSECGELFTISQNNTLELQEGDKLFELYEIKRLTETNLYAEGGFGRVYKVYHPLWDIDLVMKTTIVNDDNDIINISNEFEKWVELGIHQNIVTCHYIRSLNGGLYIFAEFIDGGTLESWIASEKLYLGSNDEIVKRIFDIAIQTARGLLHSHNHKLIHQDVKPANIMMSKSGMAKVTDFGSPGNTQSIKSYNSIPQGKVTFNFEGGITIIADGLSYTPKYAAPEQVNREKLTRRTDIWSWAITLLEMFTGKDYWSSGSIVGDCLDDYFDEDNNMLRIDIPEEIKEILKTCFEKNEYDRYHDFQEIINILKLEYNNIFDEEYPREAVNDIGLQLAGLNNHALSMYDIGKVDEAMKLWDKALEIDPHHLESTYNKGLILWRNEELSYMKFVTQLEEVRTTHYNDWKDEYLLALVHIENKELQPAKDLLTEVLNMGNQRQIKKTLEIIETSEYHNQSYIAEFAFSKVIETETAIKNEKLFVELLKKAEKADNTYDTKFALQNIEKAQKIPMKSRDKRLMKIKRKIRLKCQLKSLKSAWTICEFKTGNENIKLFELSGNGKIAVSISDNNVLKVWSISFDDGIKELKDKQQEFEESIRNISISYDGELLVILSNWENNISIYNIINENCLIEKNDIDNDDILGYIESIQISKNKKTILFGETHAFGLIDIETGKVIRTLLHEFSIDEPRLVTFCQDELHVVFACDEYIEVFNIETGESVAYIEDFDYNLQSYQIKTAAICANGKIFVSAGENGLILIWDIEKEKCVNRLKGQSGNIVSLSLSLDGKTLISMSDKNTIRIWDIEKGLCLKSLKFLSTKPITITFSPDSQQILCIYDNYIRIWQLDWILEPLSLKLDDSDIKRIIHISNLFIRKQLPFNLTNIQNNYLKNFLSTKYDLSKLNFRDSSSYILEILKVGSLKKYIKEEVVLPARSIEGILSLNDELFNKFLIELSYSNIYIRETTRFYQIYIKTFTENINNFLINESEQWEYINNKLKVQIGDYYFQEQPPFCYIEDDGKAVYWYKIASNNNDAIAQFKLANCYENKIKAIVKGKYDDDYEQDLFFQGFNTSRQDDIAKTYSKMLALYRKSAKNIYMPAIRALASFYYDKGVSLQESEASCDYEDDTLAFFNENYEDDVKNDIILSFKEAIKWYKKNYNKNKTKNDIFFLGECQYKVGIDYLNKKDKKSNIEKAIELFKEAVNNGNKESLILLPTIMCEIYVKEGVNKFSYFVVKIKQNFPEQYIKIKECLIGSWNTIAESYKNHNLEDLTKEEADNIIQRIDEDFK